MCFSRGYSPFSRGQVYNPQAPFIKGDFYIHYLLIRINKMKIPIQLNYFPLLTNRSVIKDETECSQ
ncbi:MAG: hypothetical protein A3K50_10820 [Planctomycetes bacterium RIFOXYD12_FULL_42_12]|nr:MAG: hypothetical protein A3K50_10820 [Planctomycetes bacterium RIFOXYD12_FULL_42_12]